MTRARARQIGKTLSEDTVTILRAEPKATMPVAAKDAQHQVPHVMLASAIKNTKARRKKN